MTLSGTVSARDLVQACDCVTHFEYLTLRDPVEGGDSVSVWMWIVLVTLYETPRVCGSAGVCVPEGVCTVCDAASGPCSCVSHAVAGCVAARGQALQAAGVGGGPAGGRKGRRLIIV